MREILFRAWDVQNKYWLNPEDVNISASGYKQVFDRGSEEFMSANAGEIILIQYVGFKDKNNKKIFEGDIAKITWTDWSRESFPEGFEYTELGVMEFVEKESFFGWKIENSLLTHNEQNLSVMIIGNVYENSELIKEIK